MRLEIVQVGDPVLRQRARELSPEEIRGAEVQQLIALMRETMRAAPGVGLAAPQIGESLALAVIEDTVEDAARDRHPVAFHVIANPRLTIVDPTPFEFWEGCLSFEGYVMQVARAGGVRVEALDHRGEPVTIDARGWYARILQHEIDHLHGTVCVDRMTARTISTVRNAQR
jgi:peptide deformylase